MGECNARLCFRISPRPGSEVLPERMLDEAASLVERLPAVIPVRGSSWLVAGNSFVLVSAQVVAPGPEDYLLRVSDPSRLFYIRVCVQGLCNAIPRAVAEIVEWAAERSYGVMLED